MPDFILALGQRYANSGENYCTVGKARGFFCDFFFQPANSLTITDMALDVIIRCLEYENTVYQSPTVGFDRQFL